MVEENKRRVGGSDDRNNLVEFALADEAGGIGPLAALDEGGGNGRTGGSGQFLELCTGGIEVEGGDGVGREGVFFSSHDGGRAAGNSSGCGKLPALAEFAGELDHDEDGNFRLRLRGAEFAGEECRVLGRTGFDQTTTDCLSAIPT